jgi:ferredoxin
MKAIIDEDACVGCGLCVDTCPAVFDMDGDVAKVIADPVPEADKESCKEAVDACPVDAITIEG